MIEIKNFRCESCERTFDGRYIHHRETMAGQYCPLCADMEKCAACGEVHQKPFVTYNAVLNNYVCEDCLHDYESVKIYIKPLYVQAVGRLHRQNYSAHGTH